MISDTDVSVVWFSQIDDYPALNSSVFSCLLNLDGSHHIISLEDEEKIYINFKELEFIHSGFDQDKKTGGIDRVIGMLEFYEKIYKYKKTPYILKIDSDILCLNNDFLRIVTDEYVIHGHRAFENTKEYQYGGAYIINCSKIDFSGLKERLLSLDKDHDYHFSKLGWPEDLTIYYFCSLFGKNKLFAKENFFGWMSFWNYKLSYDEVCDKVWNFAAFPYSFINFGYDFPSLLYRNGFMKLLMSKQAEHFAGEETHKTEIEERELEFLEN